MSTNELNQLYREQYPKHLKWVLKNKGQEADAQDTFHDAFCAVMVRLREVDNPSAYLLWTAKTHYFALCKKQGKFIPSDFQVLLNRDLDQNDPDEYATAGEQASDMSLPYEEQDLQNETALIEADAKLYNPENWGIVRISLEDLSARHQFILTLYFTLYLIAQHSQGEISILIAQACRETFRTNDTAGSINVDKNRAMENLRDVLYKRYPDAVRYLKIKREQHKENLKNKSNDKSG